MQLIQRGVKVGFPGITMVSTGWSQTDIETMISVVEKWFRNA